MEISTKLCDWCNKDLKSSDSPGTYFHVNLMVNRSSKNYYANEKINHADPADFCDFVCLENWANSMGQVRNK